MDVDAAQYASMGREMIDRGDYLHVFDRGHEYLDKPSFIFWITAASYQIFGVSNFAFKFPALLFALFGIFAAFRFAKLWYDRETAILTAVILATTQGYFHFTNDVRTDVYLTNSVIACIWMLSEFYLNKKSFYWIGAFAFAGIAMLAKGPIGLMVPALAFGTHILLTGNWKVLWRWQWLVGLVILFLMIAPMVYGLYTQFDLHPEKVVNGKQGVSGLRFYFWEQSFGRITGENVWKNDSGPFFFVHSLAWSFLPWSLFFFAAIIQLIRRGIKSKWKLIKDRPEWISLGGFLLPFIALSASKYKLPHYIYVVFPLAAVITANYLVSLYRTHQLGETKILNRIQYVVLIGCWAFAGLIFIWFFPLTQPILVLIGLAGFIGLHWIFFSPKIRSWHKTLYMSLVSVCVINVLMATWFYPKVLAYQSGSVMGRWMKSEHIQTDDVFNLHVGSRAMDVYAQGIVRDVSSEDLDSLKIARGNFYIYTDQAGLKAIQDRLWNFEVVYEMGDFPATLLRMNFANPQKRPNTLRPRFLIKVKS